MDSPRLASPWLQCRLVRQRRTEATRMRRSWGGDGGGGGGGRQLRDARWIHTTRTSPFNRTTMAKALTVTAFLTTTTACLAIALAPREGIQLEEESLKTLVDLPQSGETAPTTTATTTTSRLAPQWGEDKVWLWGSTRYGLQTASTATTTAATSLAIRTPAPWRPYDPQKAGAGAGACLALRDLALGERYAVAVDARGDVYQWGEGFSGDDDDNQKPCRTLAGKDICQVQATADRVFALSRRGQLIAFEAAKARQDHAATSSRWWTLGLFPRTIEHQDISRGETFVKVSAGRDHLLALSRKGKVWALPLSAKANEMGQLGSAAAAAGGSAAGGQLLPIPSLETIQVADVAAGAEHSLCATHDGRLMVFGSNLYGQLFLGSAGSSIEKIAQPLEVALGAAIVGKGGHGRVVQVEAGGATSYLVVEKRDAAGRETIDLVAAGRGQYGGLGSGSWSMMGGPSRVKSLSSLVEFSEHHQAVRPIGIHSVSAGDTHVAAVLDNHSSVHTEDPIDRPTSTSTSGDEVWGRDVYLWGHNFDGQLGNGRRSNSALPQHLPPLVRTRSAKRELGDVRTDGDASMRAPSAAGVAALTAGTPSPMPHARCQLYPPTRREVCDLAGRKVRGSQTVEQRIVCGYGTTAVYTKIVQ